MTEYTDYVAYLVDLMGQKWVNDFDTALRIDREIMAQRQTFGWVGDQFSRLTGTLLTLAVDEAECHLDVDRWHAPSECHGDVVRTFERKFKEALEEHGMSPFAFLVELYDRVGFYAAEKFIYFSGILDHFSFDDVDQARYVGKQLERQKEARHGYR